MRMQVGRGLSGCPQTGTVNVVARNHRIDRTDVHFAGMVLRTGFHKVLDKRLCHENDVFEPFYLAEVVHKAVHLAFRLGQLRLPVGIPERIVLHHGVDILDLAAFLLEQFGRDFLETEVGVSGGATHLERAEQFLQVRHLTQHVVLGQHPFPAGQLAELLHDDHILHKIDVRLLRQVHDTLLHPVRGIGQHIQMSGETKIL